MGYVTPNALFGGSLVVNAALTYLDGELESEVDADVAAANQDIDVDGTTIGLNGGVSWAKLLAQDLRLVLGTDFSRYPFDDDDADIDETIIRLRTALRYSF